MKRNRSINTCGSKTHVRSAVSPGLHQLSLVKQEDAWSVSDFTIDIP